MTYKQIETSREIRLWIGQILVPATMAASVILANPENMKAAKAKMNETKAKIKSKCAERKLKRAYKKEWA